MNFVESVFNFLCKFMWKIDVIAFISFKMRCHIEHFHFFLLIGNFMFSAFFKSCRIFQTFDHESIKKEINKVLSTNCVWLWLFILYACR